MDDSPFQAAIRAVKDGLSARGGLAAARAAGVRVQDSTWYRMVGEVRRSLADQIDEVTRPLSRRPLPDEIQGYVSKKARGYIQNVDILVKDRETGAVSIRPYSVKTSRVYARATILKRAIAAFQSAIDLNPGDYDEQVLGAAYTSTFQYIPEDSF